MPKKNKEPDLKIPPTVGKRLFKDFLKNEWYLYIPIPGTVDNGIYVSLQEFAELLRVNKNSPPAIQYLADML